MTDFLIYEQQSGVVTLTMNNPDKRNSLTGDARGNYQADDFEGACNRVNADMSVKAVILTGAGSSPITIGHNPSSTTEHPPREIAALTAAKIAVFLAILF